MNIEKNLNSFREREEYKFSDLVVYTATLYGEDETSKIRQALFEKFLENTAKLGVKCVVVDGGSNEDFIKFARSLPNVDLSIEPELSMGESRRHGLDKAMSDVGASYFLWVEPEKYDLINEYDLKNMIVGLREDRADIVVPHRSGMETMPKFQAWIESRANKRAMKIAGIDEKEATEIWDLWFGPKMFNREGAKYFQEYRGELDKWDSIIKPVIDAYQAGKKILSVDVNYKYDPAQKKTKKIIKQ